MNWHDAAWQQTQPVYRSILRHPFIEALMAGTLSRECFLYYIHQDALYLAEYGKVLAGVATRLSEPAQVQAFLAFATDSIAVEQALHESFLRDSARQSAQPSPGCLLYTSYLHKQLATASVEVALAATLPCFQIYKAMGDHILANQTHGDNPYQDWIDTYGGEAFAEAVATAIAIGDTLAEQTSPAQRQRMTDAYLTASRMEWKFWESAWQQESWPV